MLGLLGKFGVLGPVSKNSNEVVVSPWPKIVFFYPLWIVSLICFFIPDQGVAGQIWMAMFALNVLVVAADFSEERSLIAVLAVMSIVFALLWFEVLNPVLTTMSSVKPGMNDTFYLCMFALFSVVFVVVRLYLQFDHWIFRPTEVVHRSGIFPRYKRYSTEQMRWQKEIPDILERLLANSGRLVMTTPLEASPITIEHVLNVNDIDDQIGRLLGVRRVIAESAAPTSGNGS